MTDRADICAEVREKFSSYIDGELSAVEKLGMDSHLERCSGCVEELAALREVVDWLGTEGRKVPPAPTWEGVEATVLERSTGIGRLWREWLSRDSMLAAGLATIALLGLLWAARSGIEQGPSETKPPSGTGVELRVAGLPGFDSFLIAHQAEEVSPPELRRRLDFPPLVLEELPGGYRLDKAFLVQGGGSAGSCLVYRRGQEVVGLIQQLPSQKVNWGRAKLRDCSFAGSHCRLGENQGVEVLQIEPDGQNLTVVSKAGSLDPTRMVRSLLDAVPEPGAGC